MADMLVTTVEVGIDVAGLEKHLHCSKPEILLRLSKDTQSFAREVAKNPTYFHFFGSIDLDDLTEPASMARFIKDNFIQFYKLFSTMVTKQDLQNAIGTLEQDVQDEITRFGASLQHALLDNKLPDGSVVLSADEAQSMLEGIQKISGEVKAADVPEAPADEPAAEATTEGN